MDFAQVETKFKELKGQYDAGAITEDEFKAQLEELMIQDKEGNWWIIGYETGQWYYHDGEKWILAPRPGETWLQRVRDLLRTENFVVHFLPPAVARVIILLVSALVFLPMDVHHSTWLAEMIARAGGVLAYQMGHWTGAPFLLNLLAIGGAFFLWLVLQRMLRKRGLMILCLALGSQLILLIVSLAVGLPWSISPLWWWVCAKEWSCTTLPLLILIQYSGYATLVVLVLGYALSLLFAKWYRAKAA